MRVRLSGPKAITGFAQIYVARPTGVRLDGRDLERSASPRPESSYSYDESTGVLRLRYGHDRPHTLEVTY
jgi:hypothetical protein